MSVQVRRLPLSCVEAGFPSGACCSPAARLLGRSAPPGTLHAIGDASHPASRLCSRGFPATPLKRALRFRQCGDPAISHMQPAKQASDGWLSKLASLGGTAIVHVSERSRGNGVRPKKQNEHDPWERYPWKAHRRSGPSRSRVTTGAAIYLIKMTFHVPCNIRFCDINQIPSTTLLLDIGRQ